MTSSSAARSSFPISAVMIRAKRALSASRKSAVAVNQAARCANVVFRYDRKALSAVASFLSISRRSIAANSFSVSPVAGSMEAMAISHLQPQAFWNQEAIEQIEAPLHEQRQDRGWNCTLQNRNVIVQTQSAEDWFPEAARANQRGKGSGADIDHRARFYSPQDRARRDR